MDTQYNNSEAKIANLVSANDKTHFQIEYEITLSIN